jgi:uncharacterized protein (TIGR00661 family)
MTQALACQQWCRRQGHSVVGVLAGTNPSRSLPAFFERGFDVPVERLRSPGFQFRAGRSVSMVSTAWRLMLDSPDLWRSLRQLDTAIERTRPDLIINFLEPLVGLRAFLGRGPRVPALAVGHQFMLRHPSYVQVREHRLQQWGLHRYVDLLGHGAMHYALSFYEAPDPEGDRCIVAPPLLRDEVLRIEPQRDGGFLLVYLLNHGYRAEIEAWHRRNPGTEVHCFYDRPGATEPESPAPGLTFHPLHGEKFVQFMARSRGVGCTAGFESVSEAALLGKPVFMVPVENHIEQYLNAHDAAQCGLGLFGATFDLDRLNGFQVGAAHDAFRRWVGRSDEILAKAVLRAANNTSLRTAPADGPVGADIGIPAAK